MRVYKGKPTNKLRKPSTKTRIAKTKKQFFKCLGGPYDGDVEV